MRKNRLAEPRKPLTDMELGASAAGRHWDPVAALLGKAASRDAGSGHLSKNWQENSACHKMSAPERLSVLDAAKQAIQTICSDTSIHKEFFLRSLLIERSVSLSLSTLSRLGMFGEALEALEASAGALQKNSHIHSSVAALVEQACEARPSKDPLTQDERLARLARSTAWNPKHFEMKRPQALFIGQDVDRLWARALPAVFKAAQNVNRAASCAALVKAWADACWEKIDNAFYFIQEHGAELGRQKIKDGKLDAQCWRAMPFGMKMGLAFALDGSSKMGAWATGALIESAAESTGPEGEQRRAMACAVMWLCMDRKKIDAIEAAFGADASGRLLTQGARVWARQTDMTQFAAREKLAKTSAAWALKAVKQAGIADPATALSFEDPERWLSMVELLKARRLARELKTEAPAVAKKKSSALRM
jgi:hypothetical protein